MYVLFSSFYICILPNIPIEKPKESPLLLFHHEHLHWLVLSRFHFRFYIFFVFLFHNIAKFVPDFIVLFQQLLTFYQKRHVLTITKIFTNPFIFGNAMDVWFTRIDIFALNVSFLDIYIDLFSLMYLFIY